MNWNQHRKKKLPQCKTDGYQGYDYTPWNQAHTTILRYHYSNWNRKMALWAGNH